MLMLFSSFTGANFTGFKGQSLRFQTLDDNENPVGNVMSGQVQRIFKQGRQTSVEMYIPALKCTHIYEAKRIYYKGASNWKGGGEE